MTLGDFSQQATAYQRSRPTYPDELVQELCTDANLVPGNAVADFGAGTGIFTRLLVERGFHVTAIEPNEAMQHGSHVPEAKWVFGTFESSRLDTASQDWAVAAQAFHWAHPPGALPELHRILRPGKMLTVLWNNRSTSESEILAWTEQAIRRHVPEFDEAYRSRDWDQILASTGHFQFVRQRTVHHNVSMSRERYLELWRSHNRLNNIAGPERFAAFYRDLSDHLKHLEVTEIAVPYRCEAWSAVRND